jgi:hypothetical protein
VARLVTTNLAYGGDKLPGVEGKDAIAHAAVAAPGASMLEGAPRAAVTAPLDGAHATWMAPDSLFIATKSGILLLLSLLWDGRVVTGCAPSPTGPALVVRVEWGGRAH